MFSKNIEISWLKGDESQIFRPWIQITALFFFLWYFAHFIQSQTQSNVAMSVPLYVQRVPPGLSCQVRDFLCRIVSPKLFNASAVKIISDAGILCTKVTHWSVLDIVFKLEMCIMFFFFNKLI